MSTSAMPSTATQSVIARMDRIPVATRSQRRWGLLVAGAFVFELADLNTFGVVAPELRDQWHLSLDAVGWITSLAFLGMAFGSVIGGRLADYLGRKKALVIMTLLFSAASLLSAAATGAVSLSIYRILTGAGLTGMTVVALTYVSEMFPRAVRGRYLSWIFGAGLLGIPVISWFARWVVPHGPNGWRWVFILGGIGIALAAAMMWLVPESIRWQAHRGHTGAAERTLDRIEAEAVAQIGAALPPVVIQPPAPHGKVRDLFSSKYRKRTIVFLVISVFSLLGFYGYSAMLPTLLVEHGFSQVTSLTYTSIAQIGAIPGALLAYPFIDRWERKNIAAVTYVAIAVLAIVYGYANHGAVIVACGFIIAMLLQTSTVAMYSYGPEIFPTRLRGVGGGLGQGLGRLATFGGANLLPHLFSRWGYASVFIYVAGALTITAIVIWGLGERTRGRSLEEIETRYDNLPDAEVPVSTGTATDPLPW